MGEGGAEPRELDETPTWAVASVCTVIILISILLEKGLHHLGQWFTTRKKKPLFDALEKVKAELMILGFISLLLTFGQSYIAQICITEAAADTMLPCSLPKKMASESSGSKHHPQAGGEHKTEMGGGPHQTEGGEGHHRRLLWNAIIDFSLNRRVLSEGSTGSSCPEGKVSLVSVHALHQLHIFIFFLAVFHVIYSALTMVLGRAKIREWKNWESETDTDFEYSNDPSRFRLSHETSFVKQHTSLWNKIPVSFYIVSFFRQFFRSVRKADYLTMRHGFITVHLAPGSKFDFRKYIKRSLEDDFKVIVGISPLLWASGVIFLLLNVNGWQTMFWISVAPPIIILAVGTKLQAIITRMALEIQERHAVVQGMPVVQLSDRHFWFGRPHLVLFLIHFTLFQNAFQIIYSLWIWYEYGLNSCFHENIHLVIARMCLGVGVQFLCSYITLPLYALVSQMGSQMKKTIFDEQTSKALKKWHQAAKKKQPKGSGNSPSRSPNVSPRGSPVVSPTHPIQRFKSIGHSAMAQTPSRRRQHMEQDPFGAEAEVQSTAMNYNTDLLTGSTEQHVHIREQRHDQDDFVFTKP